MYIGLKPSQFEIVEDVWIIIILYMKQIQALCVILVGLKIETVLITMHSSTEYIKIMITGMH